MAVRDQFPVRLNGRLEYLSNSQVGNVVVYSGFSPFVCAGLYLGGWTFALDVRKGKRDISRALTPKSFQVTELYDHLANVIKEAGVSGLKVADKLYVKGREIRDDVRFLPEPLGQPVTHVEESLLRKFMGSPTQAVRHYKTIQVVDLGGDIVLSIFLQFVKNAQNLFAETYYYLLTPIGDNFRGIDTIRTNPTWQDRFDLILLSAVLALPLWVLSPLRVVLRVLGQSERETGRRNMRQLIKDDPRFDYGASTSIRETESSGLYWGGHFQHVDKDMHQKILEGQILDGIIEFLDSKDVDTSDLRERQTAILNNGVFVTGGSIKAESLAVGKQAKSLVTRNGKAKRVEAGVQQQKAQ